MAESNSLKWEIKLLNPERYEEMIRTNEDFQREVKGEFLRTVFEIHKFLIRISPVDTGELRGGWAGILAKYGQDYTTPISDPSLYPYWKGHQEHMSDIAISLGLSECKIFELPLDIEIQNEVPQAYYMEVGTSKMQGHPTTDIARFKGEHYFNQVFNEWFDKIAKAEKVVKPDPLTDKQLI